MEKPKSKRRKLTPFLCQEMLYDFALGRLDIDRKTAVEEFLKNDQECRGILDGVKTAMIMTDQLRRTEISPEVLAHLRQTENAVSLGRKYSSWKAWPDSMRWSITAIVLSGMIATVVAIVPWNRISALRQKKATDVVELAELPRPTEQQLEAANDNNEGDHEADDQGSGDEEVAADESAPVSSQPVAAAPPPVAPAKPAAPTPLPQPPVPTKPTTVAANAKSANPPDEETDDAPTEKKRETKPKGFVYRAFMNLGNLEELGPKIAENITELGGEKAGEVELGWRRGAGRYYHFSLPQESEEKLLEKLRAYGPVRLSKDPHPRVMPQGQVRFILWVEPL